jgi:4-amino-4-deoxy-L-arabinose transferase-like glycosyltransferase
MRVERVGDGSSAGFRSGPAPLIPPLTWLGVAAALALLCWLAFFQGLGNLGLTDKTESLFVEVARGMAQRGDWITPWWNGERFFDYPVWGYWMVAMSFRLFGPSAWAARLPVALAASAVVVALFMLLVVLAPSGEQPRRRLGRAGLAAALLATSPGWIGWGRIASTDMFLASAISLALFGFLLAHHHPPRSRPALLGQLAMALFAAIAVLAKGPVGLLLPGLVLVVFLTLTRGWSRWWQPRSLAVMALVFLLVVVPWYALAAQANGMAFLGGFLGFSNLQRFTSVLYNHPGPPWFYLPWLAVLLLPWSIYLPEAIARLRFWRLQSWREAGQRGDAALLLPLFLLTWLGVMLVFYSAAATKLPGYILPLLPAGSLLVALLWQPLVPVPAGGGGHRPAGWVNALLLGALALAAGGAGRWAATDPAYPALGAALAQSGLPLRLALLLGLASLALMALLLNANGNRWLWLPNLAAFLALLALVIPPLALLLDRERQLPLRHLAVASRQSARPDEPLWVVGTKRYSIVFYSGAPAVFVADRRQIRQRWRHDPGDLFLTARSKTIRLLGDRQDLEQLRLDPADVAVLARDGEQQLWRIPVEGLQP